MNTLGLIVLGSMLILAIGWSIYDFAVNAQRFIAPDNADRDAINAQYGEGTPEARAALNKRVGPGDHWCDAATGLTGLAGLVMLLWIWFG